MVECAIKVTETLTYFFFKLDILRVFLPLLKILYNDFFKPIPVGQLR